MLSHAWESLQPQLTSPWCWTLPSCYSPGIAQAAQELRRGTW